MKKNPVLTVTIHGFDDMMVRERDDVTIDEAIRAALDRSSSRMYRQARACRRTPRSQLTAPEQQYSCLSVHHKLD